MLSRVDAPTISLAAGLSTAVLFCAQMTFSALALAEDWYQVEVVLFEYTEPDAGGELWYENPGLPSPVQTIGLLMESADSVASNASGKSDLENPVPEADNLAPYLALPKQDYRLEGVRRTLASSTNYRPLLHVAWQQPGLDRRNVRAVRLDSARLERITAKQRGAAKPADAVNGSEYMPPVKVFDGIVRLRKSRFLHLDVDFAYFPVSLKQPDLATPEQAAKYESVDYVRLTQSRRIKPEEINYFDHPLFGLLIQVSLIETR